MNVEKLDEAVAFYSKLFDTQPAKLKDGYANFAIAEPSLKLVLLENPARAAQSTTSVSKLNQVRRSTPRLPG
ncbi:cadmium-induced protein CadI [Mycobacterium xenopi 3993]|nr:cadmium-induced protein CadI [Mycobacterium xenopi 3993]